LAFDYTAIALHYSQSLCPNDYTMTDSAIVTHPTVIIPGYLAAATDYQSIQTWLTQQGVLATIVPLKRSDWLPTLGGRSVWPILSAIDATVQQLRQSYNNQPVNLIAHSAGGWIARIYLGAENYHVHGMQPDKTYAWRGHEFVDRLITLGTPQTSQERWTKKNLEFVNQTYPEAFQTDVKYFCIAGKSVLGQRQLWGAPRGSWLAHSSYELTCGQGAVWGDGITPIAAAHLKGAENVVLDNVWHSPRSPGVWYGSESVIPLWAKYLAD
jgi:pimeloyl-ACP methyl ester carboxylesterase